jgi:hypothetical protein
LGIAGCCAFSVAQQPAIAKKAQSRNFIVPSAGRLRPRLY